ncbi:MAG: peptidoglycan DD-metalloendopeptidase family protein [Pseudomonadota bacterium]|nr:peptidoglycan DD-metalloendopeptidase family protein [Pseudomonadota bacterium]
MHRSLRVAALLATCIGMLVFASGCGVSPRVRVQPMSDASTPRHKPPSDAARSVPATALHRVVRGDTLYSVAFRTGLDVRDLIAWNQIVAPYTIYPGQLLRLQSRPNVSPSAMLTSSASAVTAKPITPTSSAATTAMTAMPKASVRPTLLGAQAVIDHSQPAQVEALDASPGNAPTAANTVVRPLAGSDSSVASMGRPQPGSLIAAIGAPPQSTPAAGQRASPGFNSVPPVAKVPLAVALSAPPPAAALVTSAPTTAAMIDRSAPSQSREGIQWRWPTSGTLLGRFVAGDPTQQGIDIGGSLGQPVLAVAAGEVVYSGNGLLGYGEMIIVQHSADYLSAYGHNQRRLVAEGAKVQAGQVIAEMGQRGSQVMLHFEVRRRGKPVDPLAYLPPR